MEGAIKMAREVRYGKPNMLNMPAEWGREIIQTIISTPPTDLTKLEKKAAEFEKEYDVTIEDEED